MSKRYDNIIVAKRLAAQTLTNFDTLSLNDIKRRLGDIIECLDSAKEEQEDE